MQLTVGLFLLILFQFGTLIYGGNILAIIPTASFSHQVVFQPLWKSLAARGHNITLVTSNPIIDADRLNITQIDISYGYEYMKQFNCTEIASDDSKGLLEAGGAVVAATAHTNERFFQSPEGQNLIHNKDNKFDLLIAEALLIDMIVFSWKYQIPYIGVSSLDCSLQFHDTLGNLNHPIITPDPNLYIEDLRDMSFWDRLNCFISMYGYKHVIYGRLYKFQHQLLSKYFGNDLPPLYELQKNMSVAFIATNPIFHSIRALMPNTITIGNGMHISPPEPLPKDIDQFFNSTDEDIVYFSLGSNIKGNLLNDSTKLELTKAFADLPYKVLWKIDQEIPNLPKNVITKKWLPQQDVLRHPKVKVFITQGGIQSMQESIYFKKPMIGIPFFGDQHMNVKRMIHLGYGVKVPRHHITKVSIADAITEVMSNPKYREKAEYYGEIFKDTDMPNVDKAVWWTEFVLRHNGANVFRNPALDMPLWKYMMLDVFSVVFAVIFITMFVLYKITKRFLGRMFSSHKSSVNSLKKYN